MISHVIGPLGTSLGTLRGRVLRLTRSESSRGAALSIGLKIGSSALNLLMLTLLARSMSSYEFGVFALWFNALAFLAVAAGLGQEKLILRSWNEYAAQEAWSLARGALRFGTRVSVAGSLVLAAAIVIAGSVAGSDPRLVGGAGLFLIVQTLFLYTAHVNRAMIGILRGDMHELTWRIVVIVAALAALGSGADFQASHFFIVAAFGMGLGLVAQILAARRHMPVEVREAEARTEPRLWAARSLRMALGGNLEAASQYLDVLAVGLVLSPSVAGGYFVASRLANVFSMITGGLNSYSTRQIPRQHHGDGRAAVASTLRRIALITTVPVALGLLGIVVAGAPLLGLFGQAFVTGYPVLVVLSLGTAFVALAGPAPAVLLLTGHEGAYSLLLAASLALRLVSLLVLAWYFGPIGAAVASAVSATVGAVALNIACRRRAGLDPAVTLFLRGRETPR